VGGRRLEAVALANIIDEDNAQQTEENSEDEEEGKVERRGRWKGGRNKLKLKIPDMIQNLEFIATSIHFSRNLIFT
jgi:uncharacterized FlaG/YvyC family protein